MKTAISIPNDVFLAAERAARQKGISRSQLYVRAIEAYLRRNRNPSITRKLNRVYAADPSHDRVAEAAALTDLPDERW